MPKNRSTSDDTGPLRFIPGTELSRRYFHEIVEPIVARAFPDLRYGAALIGYGSEVLGFDTPMSTDHNWGPRVLLFLREEDQRQLGATLLQWLDENVSARFLGWPTRLMLEDPLASDADAQGYRPAALRVELHAFHDWLRTWLGVDCEAVWDWRTWLGIPEQALLEVTEGAVYRDDLGEITAIRERLSCFPRDVWLYKLACQWTRIGQEQAFVGRTADVGDELGSRIIAARLARDVMRLCFLIERRYAPYPKWFGSAFARLPCAHDIGPLLAKALATDERRSREVALAEACRLAAGRHIALGHPGTLKPKLTTYTELSTAPAPRSGVQSPRHAISL